MTEFMPLPKHNWINPNGAPGGIRTPDTQYRKLVLYPLSYERALPLLYGRSS